MGRILGIDCANSPVHHPLQCYIPTDAVDRHLVTCSPRKDNLHHASNEANDLVIKTCTGLRELSAGTTGIN